MIIKNPKIIANPVMVLYNTSMKYAKKVFLILAPGA
jgi:hypothetical protein